MKFIALAVLASFTFASAQAAVIASCHSVEHHGHYVEIKDDDKKISVSITNDSDDSDVFVTSMSMTKNGFVLKDGGSASWAIRKAISDADKFEMSGVVAIKGKLKKENILLNLNTYSGQHFLMVGDYIQELKCNKEFARPLAPELNLIEKP